MPPPAPPSSTPPNDTFLLYFTFTLQLYHYQSRFKINKKNFPILFLFLKLMLQSKQYGVKNSSVVQWQILSYKMFANVSTQGALKRSMHRPLPPHASPLLCHTLVTRLQDINLE